jgi:hypothetical protein
MDRSLGNANSIVSLGDLFPLRNITEMAAKISTHLESGKHRLAIRLMIHRNTTEIGSSSRFGYIALLCSFIQVINSDY